MSNLNKLLTVTAAALSVFFTFGANANPPATPTCLSNAGVGYCKYFGTVRQLYVNSYGTILMYFEANMPENTEDGLNYDGNITSHAAAAFNQDDNPEFAKMLYSTLLTAKASDARIHIQLRGVSNGTTGYPLIDRVWLVD